MQNTSSTNKSTCRTSSTTQWDYSWFIPAGHPYRHPVIRPSASIRGDSTVSVRGTPSMRQRFLVM
jgi:hypothetical protein